MKIMSSLRLEVIFDGVADKPPGTANRPAGQLDECIALKSSFDK